MARVEGPGVYHIPGQIHTLLAESIRRMLTPLRARDTVALLNPEQVAGEIEKVDARADVFGLGAILTVLLTGKPPYVGETFESVRVQVARTLGCPAYSPPSSLPRNVGVNCVHARVVSFAASVRLAGDVATLSTFARPQSITCTSPHS